ncbi:MAG TPA: hypothetical protein VF713_17915 [Thermoanaerobaculia bacterium]
MPHSDTGFCGKAAELRDLMSAQSEWLAREIPGFAAALAWPY